MTEVELWQQLENDLYWPRENGEAEIQNQFHSSLGVTHISNSNVAPLKRGSDGCSNNNDMGSTTNNIFNKLVACKEKAASTSAVKCIQPSSTFHPVQFQASTQQVMQLQQQLQETDHDDMSPQCGSSTMFIGPVEGNAANYSINRSDSGSNHGRNVHNGSSTVVNAVGMNTEIANGIADKTLAGSSGGGLGQSSFAWREVALKKFRQKRKERNFGKKVWFQSRKRQFTIEDQIQGVTTDLRHCNIVHADQIQGFWASQDNQN